MGSLASLDARVVHAGGDALTLTMSLAPVAGTSPDDLARRYAALRTSAGLAGGATRAMLDRLRITPAGTTLQVEMTASAAELAPYLQRLTQGEMPWS